MKFLFVIWNINLPGGAEPPFGFIGDF